MWIDPISRVEPSICAVRYGIRTGDSLVIDGNNAVWVGQLRVRGNLVVTYSCHDGNRVLDLH